VKKREEPKTRRQLVAEFIALATYGVYALLFSWLLEAELLEVTDSLKQWVWIHGIYGFLKYGPLFPICAKIVDKTKSKIGGTPDYWFRWNLANGIGLSLFQMPIYMFSTSAVFVFMGLFWSKIESVLVACFVYTAENLCFGWIYGLFRKELCWRIARVKIDNDGNKK
jgi:hypothetical protein